MAEQLQEVPDFCKVLRSDKYGQIVLTMHEKRRYLDLFFLTENFMVTVNLDESNPIIKKVGVKNMFKTFNLKVAESIVETVITTAPSKPIHVAVKNALIFNP